jgi:chlorobenzene dioxygenase small subunit/benzene/toluene dioxygenase beta subunit
MKEEANLPDLDIALNLRVQQFYNYEAEVLDDRCFRDWLALFDKSATYRMPIRRTVPPRERKFEFTTPGELSIFDESYEDLSQRIAKLETGKAWAEEPPSRTRHCVSNLRVRHEGTHLAVRSNFIIFQGRFERDSHVYYGEKLDLLKESSFGAYGLTIIQRLILLDHTTLEVPAVSIFF